VFEQQYDEEMSAEIRRLEARARAVRAGHPEWENACTACGCRLEGGEERCTECGGS